MWLHVPQDTELGVEEGQVDPLLDLVRGEDRKDAEKCNLDQRLDELVLPSCTNLCVPHFGQFIHFSTEAFSSLSRVPVLASPEEYTL